MILKTAIILAGGKGTRLEEKSLEIPKPLIPVQGTPLLERILNWLKKNGIERVIIGVAYKKEKVKEYFGDGSKFGLKITYTEHDENGGTEDAFKTAIEKSGVEDEDFYAMNGDQLTDLQLEGLTNYHLQKGSIATIVAIKLRTDYGIIQVDGEGDITEFQEKREVSNALMNSGIYVFNKKIKGFLSNGNIEENAFRKLIKEKKISSFYYDGMWFTVNDKKQLKKAEDILNQFGAHLN
ncbi:MAG: nucleotidyltransferase family protein [Nanoarchaeota archaeon]|nr:nucleotidyltransferase family protein [Nanoarchaeota archaeon]